MSGDDTMFVFDEGVMDDRPRPPGMYSLTRSILCNGTCFKCLHICCSAGRGQWGRPERQQQALNCECAVSP